MSCVVWTPAGLQLVYCSSQLSNARRGGLLDVIATRRDKAPLPVTVYDARLSDHHLLLWSVPISRPPAPVISVVRRPWHQLSIDELQQELTPSYQCASMSVELRKYVFSTCVGCDQCALD